MYSTLLLLLILVITSSSMSSEAVAKKWQPPLKVEELYAATSGNKFASINSPVAGSRSEKILPVGSSPVQIYSLATPNVINIGVGDQFTSGFVAINPNSKIPAAVDLDGPGGKAVNLFESASIMLYFAEKTGRFIPSDPVNRAECMNWLFWQMGGLGPMCGNFGHFMVYAPDDKVETRDYGVARYGMEVQRLCSVLDNHLATRDYLVGEEYSIADMASFPWFNALRSGYKHSSGITAKDFLSIDQYKHANAWADRIAERPAVKRGIQVCSGGVGKPWEVKSTEN